MTDGSRTDGISENGDVGDSREAPQLLISVQQSKTPPKTGKFNMDEIVRNRGEYGVTKMNLLPSDGKVKWEKSGRFVRTMYISRHSKPHSP